MQSYFSSNNLLPCDQTQIPGYYQFGFAARAQEKELRENRVEDQIACLNVATRNLVASLQGQIATLNNSFVSLFKQTSERQIGELVNSNQLLLQQLQQLPHQIGVALAGAGNQHQFQVPANNPAPPANPPPPAVPFPIADTAAASTTPAAAVVAPNLLKNPCFAIRKSSSLDGPAIFICISDCIIYLNGKENENEGVEYEAFDSLMGAFRYLGHEPEINEVLEKPVFAIRKCGEMLKGPAIFWSERDSNYYSEAEGIAGVELKRSERPLMVCQWLEWDIVPARTPPSTPPAPATANAPAAAPLARHSAAPIGNFATDARAQALITNVLQYLGGSHVQPVVDKAALPASWSAVLSEWKRLQFETFRHLSMKEWPNKEQKGRYIKRKTAVEEIERFALTHDFTLEDAAVYLDREKTNRSKTLNQHLTYLRAHNPNVTKRTQPDTGRRTQPGRSRRRSEAARIARARRDAPPPPVAVRPPARVRDFSNSFNNSQGQRMANSIIQRQNQQQLRRNNAALLARLPATADVLIPGALDHFERSNLGGG